MIRTSKHTTRFVNEEKGNLLNQFIAEYKSATEFYIDYLFDKIDFTTCESPKFISTKSVFPKNTKLSQRALKCASTQACGMIKAQTEKPRKVIFVIGKLKEENQDSSKLEEWLRNYKFSKPQIKNGFSCELNSICCDFKENETKKFNFIQLKSIGKIFKKIRIPISYHRQSLKWKKQGKILPSFLINEKFIDLRYEIPTPKLKENGKIVGADQGKSTCLSLSDGQVTKTDNQGWDLSTILAKLAKKKKGSKAFKKTEEHRKNYINWSINQLNLSQIKKINLEKIKDLRKGKKTSRLMSHWAYALIKSKLIKFCEEQKVSVSEQSCVYRSQRCNQCGLVRKSQRQGKIYACSCGYVGDADINASLNHEINLPSVDFLRGKGHNIGGFYWIESGIYDLCHKELTVPCTKKL